jgi:hypothetical protein
MAMFLLLHALSHNYALSAASNPHQRIILTSHRGLPLAAVLTPGTITFQPTLLFSQVLTQPRQQNFWPGSSRNLEKGQADNVIINSGPSNEEWLLESPSQLQVSRPWFAFLPYIPSSSYDIEFLRPTVSCTSAS